MKLGSIYRIPPTFNILSLGERGAGKTVFLVGSYAEFKQNIETLKTTDNKDSEDAPMSWFECQQTTERALLNSILQYVQNQGVYPPPTLKISDFHFAFKQQQANQRSTLCFIRWWDMPGEYCDFDNPYYQEIGASSHGCCIFINANRLIHDTGYGATFSELTRQLTLLISLIQSQDIAYPLSLIFTQCDLLPPGKLGQQQIITKAQDLIAILDQSEISYRCFYSSVKIISKEETYHLISNGISSVFSWLVGKLYEEYKQGKWENLRTFSTLHCFHCGSHRVTPSRTIPIIKKIGLLMTLRRKYRCRDCSTSKIEFLPFIWWNRIRRLSFRFIRSKTI